MIITGVKKESSVYSQFQNDKIHLLDIVTSIDGTAVSEGTLETYYLMIADNFEVTLDLYQLIGIPPMSRVLAQGECIIWGLSTMCSQRHFGGYY